MKKLSFYLPIIIAPYLGQMLYFIYRDLIKNKLPFTHVIGGLLIMSAFYSGFVLTAYLLISYLHNRKDKRNQEAGK